MKAYCIAHFGSVDGVVLRSRDDPRPGTPISARSSSATADAARPLGAQFVHSAIIEGEPE
jgi:hypothetical protein